MILNEMKKSENTVTKMHNLLGKFVCITVLKKVSDYKFPRPTFFAKARATVVLYRDNQNEQLKFINHKHRDCYCLQCKSIVKA